MLQAVSSVELNVVLGSLDSLLAVEVPDKSFSVATAMETETTLGCLSFC